MKQNMTIFLIAFVVAFASGSLYFYFKDSVKKEATSSVQASEETASKVDAEAKDDGEKKSLIAEAEILQQKGCVSCHSIEAFGIKDAMTGPDLSKAFIHVEGKHGKSLEEFLQKPTSAVMSSVIAGNPLTDEERKQIIDALKAASEK